YQYNNLMYMTAGYLAGRLADRSWEELVQHAVFAPLGMKRSNFRIAAMHKDADHALAYQLNNERQLVRTETESPEAIAPAGQINSSVAEMARYLRMMLNGGMFEGKRVLLEADVRAMMQPQMPVGPDPFSDLFGYRSYGMGLFVQSYRGVEIAHHGGNLEGASALLVMVPSKKIGVMVLANRSHTRLRDALPYEIIDRLSGMESAGLLARHREMEEKGFAGEDAAKAAGVTDRKPNTKPAHPLTEYAGEYRHPGYGPVRIGLEQEQLTLGYNKFSAPLEHWHFESFQTPADRLNPIELTRVQFHTDRSGDVTSLAIALEPNVEPIVFAKQPPAEMLERKFLEQLTGEYDSGGVPVTILLREDNVLQISALGTTRHLVPVRGTYFRVQELAGTAVEFLRDASGRIDRMATYNAGSDNIIAPRKE
nr:serine hydrolase [Chthoniobacterales bacterium]